MNTWEHKLVDLQSLIFTMLHGNVLLFSQYSNWVFKICTLHVPDSCICSKSFSLHFKVLQIKTLSNIILVKTLFGKYASLLSSTCKTPHTCAVLMVLTCVIPSLIDILLFFHSFTADIYLTLHIVGLSLWDCKHSQCHKKKQFITVRSGHL